MPWNSAWERTTITVVFRGSSESTPGIHRTGLILVADYRHYDNNNSNDPFHLYPLICSAGPDDEFGMYGLGINPGMTGLATRQRRDQTPVEHRQHSHSRMIRITFIHKPMQGYQQQYGAFIHNGMLDNITNHDIEEAPNASVFATPPPRNDTCRNFIRHRSIIGLLAAIMVPSVKYQYRNRAVIEGERQLNAFIGASRARAQQIGRPVGIWVERFIKEAPVPIVGANAALNPALPAGAIARSISIKQKFLVPTSVIYGLLSHSSQQWDRLDYQFPAGQFVVKSQQSAYRPGERFKIQLDHRGPFHGSRTPYRPNRSWGC